MKIHDSNAILVILEKSHEAVNQKQVQAHHLTYFVIQKMRRDELETTVIGK